jgi:short-subunit dehydrogenase
MTTMTEAGASGAGASGAGRRRALITGASSGLGRAFAERLAGNGFDLIVVARRRERLEELARSLGANGTRVEVIAADLSEPEGIRRVESAITAGDGIAVLVNNAGFAGYKPFVNLDPEVAERQITLHVTAMVRLTRAALPAMVERHSGIIINVSSLLSFSGAINIPHLKRANYAATKAFINTFTQTVAQELEGTGVKIQALCPGVIRTEFHYSLGGRPADMPAIDPFDVVDASLAGLAQGDVVCVPTLTDPGAVSQIAAAQRALVSKAWQPTLAARFRASRLN